MKALMTAATGSGVSLNIDAGGITVTKDRGNFLVEIAEIDHSIAETIGLYPAHSQDEIFHALCFKLPSGIEVNMEPEIGNESCFVFVGLRRSEPPFDEISDRVYLSTDGSWKPRSDNGRIPIDAVRVNLASILETLRIS